MMFIELVKKALIKISVNNHDLLFFFDELLFGFADEVFSAVVLCCPVVPFLELFIEFHRQKGNPTLTNEVKT